MALSNRDQALLWVLVAILGTSSAWLFWLSPTVVVIQAANAEIAQLDHDRARNEARSKFLDAVAEDLAAHADDERLIKLAAPADGGIADLVASLDAIATASGVSLSSIQPQSSSSESAVSALTLTLGVTGTYPAIQAFVVALEGNERPLTISNLTLARATSFGGSALVTGTLTVSALRLPASVGGGTQ